MGDGDSQWSNLVENIYFLAKEKDLKIGDLEKQVGASVGYLSRFRSGEVSNAPKLEFVTAVAKVLGVMVDDLIKIDYRSITADEEYLLKVINNLITVTNQDKQVWNRETVADIDKINRTAPIDGRDAHPLCDAEGVWDDDGELRRVDWSYIPAVTTYKNVRLCGDCYNTILNPRSSSSRATMYLAKADVFNISEEDGSPTEGMTTYDLYLISGRGKNLVCSTMTSRKFVQEKLIELYVTVAASSERTHVNDDVRSVLDVFLSGGDEDDIPF